MTETVASSPFQPSAALSNTDVTAHLDARLKAALTQACAQIARGEAEVEHAEVPGDEIRAHVRSGWLVMRDGETSLIAHGTVTPLGVPAWSLEDLAARVLMGQGTEPQALGLKAAPPETLSTLIRVLRGAPVRRMWPGSDLWEAGASQTAGARLLARFGDALVVFPARQSPECQHATWLDPALSWALLGHLRPIEHQGRLP